LCGQTQHMTPADLADSTPKHPGWGKSGRIGVVPWLEVFPCVCPAGWFLCAWLAAVAPVPLPHPGKPPLIPAPRA
jgi:hypothetical protein